MIPKEKLDMQKTKEEFLDYSESIGKALETRLHYERSIRELIDYLDSATSVTSWKEMTPDVLEGILKHIRQRKNMKLKGKTLSEHSIFNLQCNLKLFFRYMEEKGILLRRLSELIKLPKLPAPLPKHLMKAGELKALLSIPDLRLPIPYRNRSILELMYASGLRVGEICRLKLQHIDTTTGTVLARKSARHKERLVPIAESACQYMREYLNKIRPRLVKTESKDFVFLSKSGKPLRRKDIADFVRSYRVKAGIEKSVTPHTFRHQVATDLLNNGADIRHIQQFLGHENLNTTQIYTRVNIVNLKKVYKKCHPNERQKQEAKPFEGGNGSK